MDDHDGADAIEHAWRDGLRPDPLLTVSEWADRYRVLSQRASSEPGRWRTERTPYLREIMDCLSPSSPVQRVALMKGAQIGGTECGNCWIGYVIHQAPGPMMAVSPTVELARRNSKQRIDPLIEESEVLRERVKERRSRDSGNTVLSKEFPGGVLILTGANSGVGLRSMPARYLFLDEVDGYPGDVEGEGDPILLGERRSATFQRRKILLVSTPKTKGVSRIDREYEASDQRRYFVPCPHCHEPQVLDFANLRWPESRSREAEYACAHCGALIGERHKTWMLEHGEWQPAAPGDGRTAGFHLSSLYSPVGWFSWADAADMYDQALRSPDLMKGFVNTVLGLPFEEEAEAPEWQRLYERRESYRIGVVPEAGLFLTAGVDVQKDRIEVEVVAWGRGKESWSVDYWVIEGDTARAEVWAKLDAVLAKDWPDANGHTVAIRVMCVDAGYATQDVYAWVRGHPQASWGPGRRRRAAAAYCCGGEGSRPGHGAAALGLEGRCRRQAAWPSRLVGRYAGRQGRAVPLGQAGVADRGSARRRRKLSARRLPLPAIRRGVLQAAHGRAAGHPDRQGLPARVVGEGAGPAQRGPRLPGLRAGSGRDLRSRPLRGAALAADGGSFGAHRGAG
jgi:phage terminase large subunit GpA-like protein